MDGSDIILEIIIIIMEMAKDAEKNEGKKNEIYFVNIHIFHGVNAAKEGPTFLVPIADDPALNEKLYMY